MPPPNNYISFAANELFPVQNYFNHTYAFIYAFNITNWSKIFGIYGLFLFIPITKWTLGKSFNETFKH